MLIDTHAHLNFRAFKNDADEVIRRSLNAGALMINVGSNYETSKKAKEIAERYPVGVFATIGLHPLHLQTRLVKMKIDLQEIAFNTNEEKFDYERYKELARSKKVIAVGEIGLDYYYKPKTKARTERFKEKQREALFEQLRLAKELNLPVIFHCRMAHQDLIQFLKENEDARPPAAAAHGFVGSLEELKEYLNFGYCIGFNGIIFKKIEGIDFQKNIRQTPLEKILIETDCPYLTPPQEEGRNEPIYIKHIAQRVAEIKKLSYKEITRATSENAQRLFKI